MGNDFERHWKIWSWKWNYRWRSAQTLSCFIYSHCSTSKYIRNTPHPNSTPLFESNGNSDILINKRDIGISIFTFLKAKTGHLISINLDSFFPPLPFPIIIREIFVEVCVISWNHGFICHGTISKIEISIVSFFLFSIKYLF